MLETQARRIWRDHQFMMDCFADKICDIYKPGDIIMVHDYHLMMLPRLLRRRLPDAYLTFSLHTYYHTLETPWPLRVLEGILGSNIITFQTSEDMTAFVGWCAKKYPNKSSYWATRATDACAVLPMGIDVSSVAQSQSVKRKCESLRSIFQGTKIVVSYNTLDTGAEMEDVMLGFVRMLVQIPQWRGRAFLLQVMCTSRAGDSSRELPTSLFDELIDSISAGYGPPQFRNVLYYKGQVSELEFHTLMRISDAAIFPLTPGGPMTAAMEYFARRPADNKRPIVSDINPVTRQIPEPITYRPGDIDSIVRAISYALELPDRPPMRFHRSNFGNMNTAERWTNSVLLYLTEKLQSDRTPADISDTGAYGSCSPEEHTEGQSPDDELRGRDRRTTTGDDGKDHDGLYYGEEYYDEGDYEGDYEEDYEGDYEGDYAGGEEGEEGEEDKNDGGDNGGEEDGLEGNTEPGDSEYSEETEMLVTRSAELERMGDLREVWAGKMPATV